MNQKTLTGIPSVALVRCGWQTVNIGDIAHTPGILRVLERHLPTTRLLLWPGNFDRGVETLIRDRFPSVRFVYDAPQWQPEKPQRGELRRFVPGNAALSDLLFPDFPSYDALLADLKRAGIERRDSMGRVVHFHSFRKTWQTWGVTAGISQRVAQEVLGHSDPALTANVYTDVPAVGMHDEIAKLPWVSSAPQGAPETSKSGAVQQFRKMLDELVSLAKVVFPRVLLRESLLLLERLNGCPGWDRTSDQVINSFPG